MPNRRRSPFLALLALAALATLAACGQPGAPIDPATLPQAFSFEVANPADLSGAVFAPVLEPFGVVPFASLAIAPAQGSAIRDAMDGATLAVSWAVAGTLTPAADLARLNEAIGFEVGIGEAFFVPEGCDVTAVNASEAAFATVLDLVVWDGTTLDADGLPATVDGSLQLTAIDGDVATYHLLVASKNEWSATSNGPCEIAPTSSYVLDLDVAVGWQFLRVTEDSTIDAQVITFETRSLADVAAAGVIGVAEPSGGFVLGQQRPPLTPIYR